MRSVSKIERAFGALAGRTFELSLTKTYVSRWGMVEAVRELIQNALDSESPFVYEFIPEEGGWTLKLKSEYTILTPQTLLLGATSKAESTDSIGSFGEGYKIALLVLTRLGYDVDILNGEVVWKPRFRFSRTFGEELLVVDEATLPDRTNKGLTFLVRGLSEADIDLIRLSCRKMQTQTGEVKTTSYGDILFDHPGKLYVGALFICETGMNFGYDIKPAHLRLERDRQTVSGWELSSLTVKMWYETGDFKRVAKMIEDDVPDVEHARYDSNEMVKEECYRLFRERHPGKLIAASASELKDEVKRASTVYRGGGMYYAVSGSASYRAERPFIEKAVMPPSEKLAAFLRDHRDEMRRPAIVSFKALVEESKNWEVK